MYEKLTGKAVKELAAPQTWPASILPVLIAGALSFTLCGALPIGIFALLLLISVLLQSAVNTLNDYFDFVKGTDTAQNSVDTSDASIIYNQLHPKTALAVGCAFLASALLGGLYLVFRCGWPLLVIGLLGALAIYFYSGGPYPISYMPIGEAVSGIMMGGFFAHGRPLCPKREPVYGAVFITPRLLSSASA